MKEKIVFSMWIFMSFSLIVSSQAQVDVINSDPIFQVFYVKPSDVKSPNNRQLDSLTEAVKEVQFYFANKLEEFGFQPKTFQFNKEIKIVPVRDTSTNYGKLRSYDIWNNLKINVPQTEFGDPNNVQIIFLGGIENLGKNILGQAFPNWCRLTNGVIPNPSHCKHMVVIPAEVINWAMPKVLAHEIGHVFGLIHTENDLDVMGTINLEEKYKLEDFNLSKKELQIINNYYGLVPLHKIENISQPIFNIDADINNDGYVDLSDVLIVRSAITHKNSYDTDVNGDGKTDEIDVLLVKQKAMEAIVAAAPSLQRRKKITIWGALKRK